MLIILKEGLCPSLTVDIVDKLKEAKITSVVTIMTANISKIRSISRARNIDFETLQKVKSELYGIYGPITTSGLHLYKTVIQKCLQFKTGIDELDQMLVSGIKERQLVEVFGETNSGKTNFCYSMLANVLRSCPKKALYVDTDLSFSIDRFSQILDKGFGLTIEQRDELLSRLLVVRAFDVPTLLDTIEMIRHDLKTNHKDSKFAGLSLVVVDSVSAPLSHELKSNTYEIEEEKRTRNSSVVVSGLKFRSTCAVSQMGFTLKNFVRAHSVAMIVSNCQSIAQKKNWSLYCDVSLKFSINNEVTREKNVTEEAYCPFRVIEVIKYFGKNHDKCIFSNFIIDEKGLHT